MVHDLKVGKYDISCEPHGEIASVTVSSQGQLLKEFVTRISYSVIPVGFEHQGEKVQLALSRNGKSYVLGNGTVVTGNWFFNRDFLSTAHRSLGLRWSKRPLTDALQILFDLAFALVMGFLFSSVVFESQSWTTFLYSFSFFFLFWLFLDFGKQTMEVRRLRSLFKAM